MVLPTLISCDLNLDTMAPSSWKTLLFFIILIISSVDMLRSVPLAALRAEDISLSMNVSEFSLNSSILRLNPAVESSPICNGTQYGNNLNLTSCRDACDTIFPDATKHIYGQRGLGSFDYKLPRRYISCEYPLPMKDVAAMELINDSGRYLRYRNRH